MPQKARKYPQKGIKHCVADGHYSQRLACPERLWLMFFSILKENVLLCPLSVLVGWAIKHQLSDWFIKNQSVPFCYRKNYIWPHPLGVSYFSKSSGTFISSKAPRHRHNFHFYFSTSFTLQNSIKEILKFILWWATIFDPKDSSWPALSVTQNWGFMQLEGCSLSNKQNDYPCEFQWSIQAYCQILW